jgi:hypothetical protein
MAMIVPVMVVLMVMVVIVALRARTAVPAMLAFGRMVSPQMIVFFHSAHLTSLAQGSA